MYFMRIQHMYSQGDTGGDGMHLYLRVFQMYLARPTACGNTQSDTMQIRTDTRIEGKPPQI